MTFRTSITLVCMLVAWALALSCGRLALPPLTKDAGTNDSGMALFDAGESMQEPDAGLPSAVACTVLNQNRCTAWARCGLIEDNALSQKACTDTLEATWCGPLTWPPHVAKGALRYDAVRAAQCADALNQLNCEQWSELPESCRFLAPRVLLGGSCYDGYAECAQGVCRGQSCPRTCQMPAAVGELCSDNEQCGPDSFCLFAPLTPYQGQCASRGALNAVCRDDAHCLSPLACLNGRCAPLPESGAGCDNGRCGPDNACTGADGGFCQLRAVDAGAICSIWNTCPPREVCVGATEQLSGICQQARAENQNCATSADCEAHLRCLAVDGGQTQCQRRRPMGSSCDATDDCTLGALCLNLQCVALPVLGESCATTHACRWGLCREVTGSDAGSICRLAFNAGQRCVNDVDCASGRCESGTCTARCTP